MDRLSIDISDMDFENTEAIIESDDQGLTDALANAQKSDRSDPTTANSSTSPEAKVVSNTSHKGSLPQLSRERDREGTKQEDEEPEDAGNTEETPLRKCGRGARARAHITARIRELRERLIALDNSDRALIQHSRLLLEDELREELLRR
ncbi:MAG: hypothetical protein Q9212_002836 [Teloschistes hypoglaucus]